MKKLLALMLATALAFSLAACGGGNLNDATPEKEDSSMQQTDSAK